MTLVGTPESRSYIVILVLRLYLLRPRAVASSPQGFTRGSHQLVQGNEGKGWAGLWGSNDTICAHEFDMPHWKCCIRNASMRERLAKYFYSVFSPFRNVFMRLYLCLTDNSILS